MPSLGPMELVLILAIVILLFGAGKIPQIGGAIGQSIKEFRSSVKDVSSEESSNNKKDGEPLAEKKEA